MPIPGESKEYYSELAALDKGVRRKPLQRERPMWLTNLLCAALIVLFLLFAIGASLIVSGFSWR